MRVKEVIWCNRGWQPVEFGFCPSKGAWKREMRKMGYSPESYPDTAACATTFTKNGKKKVIITVRDGAEKTHTLIEVVGLLVHEGVHVWQEIKQSMGEGSPSIEFEAYSVQAIAQELMAAFKASRKLPAI